MQAGDAFLERVNRSALLVRRGATVLLGVEHLGLTSNADFTPDQMTFDVVQPPQWGVLESVGGSSAHQRIDSFTLADLLASSVVYANNNNNGDNVKDKFRVRATLRSPTAAAAAAAAAVVQMEATVDVKIYPDGYWQPLRVTNNKLVTVEESTSVTIDSGTLRVSQTNVAPSDLIYMVHQPPLHGYLEVDQEAVEYGDGDSFSTSSSSSVTSATSDRDLPPEVNVFDQTAIDENRLHYIQSAANQTSDSFVLDVTNGIGNSIQMFH